MKQFKFESELSYLGDRKQMILGELERLRREKNMTAAEVSALLGKSPAYYAVVQSRGRDATVKSLAKIAAAFGLKIELRLCATTSQDSAKREIGLDAAEGNLTIL